MAKIAVAMSGGVDSSTAAALLLEDGHAVVGLTLQLWDYSAENLAAGRGRCCSPADIADARSVSAHLRIPHYVFDHSEGFTQTIVDPFVSDYTNGRTPSPCIRCNRLVKFDLLWRLARGLDADMLATGHYARLAHSRGRPLLSKARDSAKDQSYFLFDVRAEHLEQVLLPLGDLPKSEVRATADRLGLPVADKRESFELCFIPDGDKDRFLERRVSTSLDERRGTIRHVDGTVLAEHDGLFRFTVGQRRGLGVSGSEPLYVIGLDASSRAVTVGPVACLQSGGLVATRCNWISIDPPRKPLRVAARIRHRHSEAPATLEPREDGAVEVRFDAPEPAVTPGQGVAFYDGDLLLGGGWIDRRLAVD